MEKTAVLVPDERALARADAVAKLERRHLPARRLPYEQVEIVVVEPAPERTWLVGDPEDLAHDRILAPQPLARSAGECRPDETGLPPQSDWTGAGERGSGRT